MIGGAQVVRKWFHHLQIQYIDGLLDWLAQENADSQSTLHGMADMDRIATAGHSRGAKLACLQFASKHHSLLCSAWHMHGHWRAQISTTC